jgi:hypothetical protein
MNKINFSKNTAFGSVCCKQLQKTELSLKRNLPIVFSNLFLELPENKVSSFVRKIGSKIKMVQKKGDYSLGHLLTKYVITH